MASIKIKADMSGTVSQIVVQVGSEVLEDDTLILLESMKMEIPVTAPRAGRVVQISATAGETVSEGDLLVLLEG